MLNNKLVINEDLHIWNTSVEAIKGSALRPSPRIVMRDEVGSVRVVVRHTWQEKTRLSRKQIHDANMSGVLLGVRERIYAINPGDFVDIQPLVSHLFGTNNNCAKTMNKVYNRMLQLAGLSKTDELPAPSREQFLALNKAQKYASIGVGLLTLARCDELYDHTVWL